jgi:thiol:disulfide interchange protein
MKLKFLVIAFFALATAFTLRAAPKVGDTYDAVIAALGQPTGVTTAGTTVLLSYPDVVVTLRDGRVSSLKAVGAVSTVPERRITDAERRAAAAAPAADEGATWSTDAEAALERAQSSGRHVFLFFTGSDWCGWCIRLQKEILTTPEFASFAQDNLVLVELDFPQRKQQSEALKAQNAKLAKKYGIRGYPTVIVLNSEGKVVGQLGYQAGGPGPFIAKLERM